MKRDLVYLGIGLIVGGMVLTMVFSTATPLDEFGGLFQLIGFVGLVVLIVGVVKSDSPPAPLSQQQQVVLMGHPPFALAPQPEAGVSAARLRCPTCRGLNDADARFCQECGHAIPTATPSRRPAASGRRKS